MSQIVKIELTGHGQGEVYVDGKKLNHVRAIRVRADARQENRVFLLLTPAKVEMSGPFDVKTSEG